jgi:hypothetical protein
MASGLAAAKRAPDDPGFDRIMRAAARADFPVNVSFRFEQEFSPRFVSDMPA